MRSAFEIFSFMSWSFGPPDKPDPCTDILKHPANDHSFLIVLHYLAENDHSRHLASMR